MLEERLAASDARCLAVENEFAGACGIWYGWWVGTVDALGCSTRTQSARQGYFLCRLCAILASAFNAFKHLNLPAPPLCSVCLFQTSAPLRAPLLRQSWLGSWRRRGRRPRRRRCAPQRPPRPSRATKTRCVRIVPATVGRAVDTYGICMVVWSCARSTTALVLEPKPQPHACLNVLQCRGVCSPQVRKLAEQLASLQRRRQRDEDVAFGRPAGAGLGGGGGGGQLSMSLVGPPMSLRAAAEDQIR